MLATGMRATRGVSLIEAVLVIAVLSAAAFIAAPRLVEAHARAQVTAARRAFAAAHALARQVAAQYGAIGKLHLDANDHRFWVTVDTSAVPGLVVEDTVGPVTFVGGRFGGVKIQSSRRLLCFSPHGLGTARGECELPNATVIFRLGSVADTLVISRLGRVRRR